MNQPSGAEVEVERPGEREVVDDVHEVEREPREQRPRRARSPGSCRACAGRGCGGRARRGSRRRSRRTPSPTIRTSSVQPELENATRPVADVRDEVADDAAPTIAMPPIVGVPALCTCGCSIGPSSRICWPIPRLRSERMRSGVPKIATRNAAAAAMSIAITRSPSREPFGDGLSPSADSPSPAPRLAGRSEAEHRRGGLVGIDDRARRGTRTRGAPAASAISAPPAPTPITTSVPSSRPGGRPTRRARRRCASRAHACRRARRCGARDPELRAARAARRPSTRDSRCTHR